MKSTPPSISIAISIRWLLALITGGLLCGAAGWASAAKPFPSGVYESGGPLQLNRDFFANYQPVAGQDGVLIRVDWNLCGTSAQTDCLLDKIEETLNGASNRNLKVALAVSDGNRIPDDVKSGCARLVPFTFEGKSASLCQPWDAHYLAAKLTLIQALGQRFDQHPALAHVYFTGSCTTNGFEGHCRVDESQFYAAAQPWQPAHTLQEFVDAYLDILDAYRDAFTATPITLELHSIFDQTDVWEALWSSAQGSGQVGIATWWCSERLSLEGQDTVPAWALVQEAAQTTYTICQTLGSFTGQAYRFSSSDGTPFLYGAVSESAWNALPAAAKTQASQQAFTETLDWAAGLATHGGQAAPIIPYHAAEIWWEDMHSTAFQPRLSTYLDPAGAPPQDVPFLPAWALVALLASIVGLASRRR